MRLVRSFQYAFHGVLLAFKSERGIRLILLCFVLAVAGGAILNLSALEWCAVLICSGGVFAVELVNTAIECVVDMITQEYSPMAGKAKDIAAGATLVAAGFSLVVGLIIYVPHVLELLGLI